MTKILKGIGFALMAQMIIIVMLGYVDQDVESMSLYRIGRLLHKIVEGFMV
mgnify:CR=1 FL=1